MASSSNAGFNFFSLRKLFECDKAEQKPEPATLRFQLNLCNQEFVEQITDLPWSGSSHRRAQRVFRRRKSRFMQSVIWSFIKVLIILFEMVSLGKLPTLAAIRVRPMLTFSG